MELQPLLLAEEQGRRSVVNGEQFMRHDAEKKLALTSHPATWFRETVDRLRARWLEATSHLRHRLPEERPKAVSRLTVRSPSLHDARNLPAQGGHPHASNQLQGPDRTRPKPGT